MIAHTRIPSDRYTSRVNSKLTNKLDWLLGILTNVAPVKEVVAVLGRRLPSDDNVRKTGGSNSNSHKHNARKSRFGTS